MAENTIKIKVKVDDDGNLKAVGNKAKKAADSLNGLAAGSQNADRRLKGAAKASSNSTKNFSKMAQGITGGLVPAYATLAANVFALSAAFNFLTQAANYKNLISAQNAYAASTGSMLSSISTSLQEASQGYLNYGQAAEAAAIGAAKGFTTGQLTKLTDDAVKISAALGRSYEDTFNRLLRGVSKAEPELLDELGITLRLETATKRFAAANNKAAKSLTEYERGQAVLAEVNRQINNMFGSLDSADFKNPFEQLSVTFDEIVKKATQFVLPIFEGFANIINRSAVAAIAVFGMLGLSIFKAAIPTEEMGEAIDSLGDRFTRMSEKASASIKSLTDSQKQAISALEQSKAKASLKGQKQAAGFVQRGSSSKILTKLASDPTSLNKADESNLRKAFKAAEAQYKKTGQITTGIFAGENIKRVRNFEDTLKKMTASHSTWSMKFVSVHKKAWLRIKQVWAVGGKGFAVTMKGMSNVASTAGKVLNKALGVLGIIGSITILIEGFKELKRSIYDITLSILGLVDRFVQSGPGKGIVKVITFVQNAILTLLDNSVGYLTGFIRIVGEKIGAGLRLLNFNSAAENVEKLAIVDEKFDNFIATMRAGTEVLGDVSEGTASFVDMFAKSDLGEGLESIQEGALAQDVLNEKFDAAKTNIDRLNSSLASMIENYKKLKDTTSFQDALIGARAVSTTGLSNIGISALNTTDPERQSTLITGLREALGYASQLPGLMGELGRKWQNADFSTPLGIAAFIGDVQTLEKSGAEAVANFEGFRNTLDVVGASPSEAFSSIEGIDDLKAKLRDVRKAMEDTVGTLGMGASALNEEFQDATGMGLADLENKLTTLANTYSSLKTEERELNIERMQTSRLSGEFATRAQSEIALREKLLELKTIDATIEARTLELGTDISSLRIAAIAQELEELGNRRAATLENIKVTEDGMDDIKSMGLQLGNTLQSSLSSAFSSLIDGTKSAKQAFADMALSMLKNLGDIIAKMLMMRLLEGALGGSSFGNFLGVPSKRYGGIVSNGKDMNGYASGGIARGANAGYPAMLHGTEAVVPLPDGKSIPVSMQGAGQQNNVTVNVSVDNQGNASTNTQQDSAQAGNLGQVIARAVQQELQNQKRSGGILNPYGAA